MRFGVLKGLMPLGSPKSPFANLRETFAPFARNGPLLVVAVFTLNLLTGCGKPAATGDEEKAPEAAPVAVELVKAEQRPVRKLLEITGSFTASQGGAARLAPAVGGRITSVLVREGDLVQVGQLLAKIETGVQAAQSTAAQAAATAARQQADEAGLTYRAAAADQEANVKTARQAVETARVERDAAVMQAQFDYEAADADLKKIRAGARPQELAQAHQVTVQAQVARNRARAELDRDQALAKEGFIARRDLEDAQAAFATAESALASAQASEDLLKEGARPEEKRAAELKTAAARQAANNAKKVGDQRVAQAETALRQSQQAALQVEAKSREAQASQSVAQQRAAESAAAGATAALAEIRAPFAGRVSRRLLNSGDSADPATPVIELTASKGIDFVAGISVSDAAEIQPGMEAEIDLADGKKAAARVTSVSPGDSQTGLTTVRMTTGATAAIGSFCRARIAISRNANAIAVPKETLLDREGKMVLFVAQGDTVKMSEVEIGPEDSGWVEVKSGVKPGDQVVKLGQFELSDGAKIEAAAKDEKADKKEPD